MKNEIQNRWEDIDWRKFTNHFFRLQRLVFDAATRGDKKTVRRIQQKIANSFHAKALAVRQVAQISSGRYTAGIDGIKSLKTAEKMRMATGLRINHQPSSVRRVWIPKPGKNEKRPLGIPNMIDRAHQALLVLVLEPQWEALLLNRQYGFRKGRGTHDAINFIQRHLRKAGPKYVLEIDIEKFFDRLDHEELLRRLDAPPVIASAVRKILKAGALVSDEHAAPHKGTPQGGPLSPLLANIALAGLENHLESEFRREYRGRIKALGLPTLVVYADDAVVLHRERHVVEWSRTAIQAYLVPLGLNLNENKTRISHTQQPTQQGEDAGFDFLGFHVQHQWTKRSGGKREPYILVKPSKTSVTRFYRDCAERIDTLKLSRKQRGARRDRQAQGKRDPITVMIGNLNRKIRGWTNYFCKCNAKECFSGLDRLIHRKLWKWSIRRFDSKRVQWIIDHLFSGVELDNDGKPLMRLDGNPRDRKWAFKSPFVPNDTPHLTLFKLADTPIRKHVLIKPEKRFYDGDWPYWQLRMQTRRYPGTPPMVSIAAFRRQKGICFDCKERIRRGELLTIGSKDRLQTISHLHCIQSPPSAPVDSSLTVDLDSGCPM